MASPAVKSGVTEQEGIIGMLYPTPPGGAQEAMGPSEEDAKIAEWGWGLYQGAKRWKEQASYHKEAPVLWDYWEDRQWQYQRAPHLSQHQVNMVYPTIETFIGHWSDNLPESVARARNPAQKRVGEMATKLFNWSNDINSARAKMETNLRSTGVVGFSALRIDWDYAMDGKRGAPKFTFVDEDNIFLAPWTKDPELSDCRYLIEAANVPIELVRKAYPKRGPDVKPGAWDATLTPSFGGSGGSGAGG